MPRTGSPFEIEHGAPPLAGRVPARLATRLAGCLHHAPAGAVRRLRFVFVAGLLGAAVFAWIAHVLASQNGLDASWRSNAAGEIELAASGDPALASLRGAVLRAISAAGREVRLADALALQHSPRWLIDDSQRASHPALQATLREVLGHERIGLHFGERGTVHVSTQRRGLSGLPGTFWIFSLLALSLALAGVAVGTASASAPALLYTLMASCQAANLLASACGSGGELGLGPTALPLGVPVHLAFDLASAAAFVHLAAVHPRRVPGAAAAALGAWCGSAILLVAIATDALANGWWWSQLAVGACGLAGVCLAGRSHAIDPHPFALVLRRFGLAALATWLLLTAVIASANGTPEIAGPMTAHAPTLWAILVGALLLAAPLLPSAQPGVSEFALLAAVATVAASLDLLFVTVFAFGPFASLTLALFVSLAGYAGARRWLFDRMHGNIQRTTERTFEHLHQTLRQVELHPERATALLAQLLRRLFEPVELRLTHSRGEPFPRLVGGGAAMIVPVPSTGDEAQRHALLLRSAHRGRLLFTRDDAGLAGRIVDQLERALRFGSAFEQGRSEERGRLAQDLHDDIGARLLTLIYQAPTSEMQASLRHTLQDLKTLTRVLAAPQHRLGDAAAEWRAELGKRLEAAGIGFAWHAALDSDPLLSFAEWSALARILRELVSNAIAHAHASRVEVNIALVGSSLRLIVADDGCGRAPWRWANGLGLGGVRKRVHQLGGDIAWLENSPAGIRCEVTVRQGTGS